LSTAQLDPTKSASMDTFNAARRRAFMQDVLAELSGRPDNLLSFADVQEQLHLSEPEEDASLQEIPLKRIVGSVGRYRDFNRAFLPRGHIDAQRWTRIDTLRRHTDLPPIDVFKIGDVYFVQDGNHRVSVARARHDKTIHARVIEIPARVPLGPETAPDDLILKSGYADFLEKTSLDRTCPDQRIELSRPGGYRGLLKHVEVHQFYMGLRSRHYPTLAEAACNWYETVYLPVVERIQASHILANFPGRTEADLYFWVTENCARLQMRYGGQAELDEAVDDFAQEHDLPPLKRWARRILHRLFPKLRTREPGSGVPEGRPEQLGNPPSEN
jgi:uncharacterized ParB-like nuclease family protein